MKVSEKMIEQLKQFEGLRLEAYEDAGGTLTIGYGHTQRYQSGRPHHGVLGQGAAAEGCGHRGGSGGSAGGDQNAGAVRRAGVVCLQSGHQSAEVVDAVEGDSQWRHDAAGQAGVYALGALQRADAAGTGKATGLGSEKIF